MKKMMIVSEISGILGIIIGFVFSGHLYFKVIRKRKLRRRLGLFVVGLLALLSTPVFMVIGGLLVVARNPLCGISFFAMTVAWTAGGNLLIELVRSRGGDRAGSG